MQYSFVAASLVAAATAASVPAYGVTDAPAPAPYVTPAAPVYSAAPLPVVYGSSSSSSAEVSASPVLPAYYSTPSASASPVIPVYYSAPASSSITASPVAPSQIAPHYTTEIVTELTTYCPYATQITHGTKTYTVTEATTLTITDCPCTITKTAGPKPTSKAPSKGPFVHPKPTSAPVSYTPVAPLPACPSAAPPAVVSQIGDGQPQAPVTTGAIVSQIGDGQPQAPVPTNVVSQIGDGQPQAPVSARGVVSQIADGQPQAPVRTDCTYPPAPKVTTIPFYSVPTVYKPTKTGPAPVKYTGAASKATGAGAGLAAVFGVVAYLL